MKLKPCICGRKRIERWGSFDYDYYVCHKCGLKTDKYKTNAEAKKAWNEMIEKLGEKDDR